MTNEKLKLTLTYNGSHFHGWQVQKDKPTVQSTLQDAIECIAGKRISVTGCSRTDAGVHANEFVCHTDMINLPCERLPLAINAHLPDTVAVKSAQVVSGDFHARYSCLGKEYVYKIFNSHYKDPFLHGRAMFYNKPLDEKLMNDSMQALVGKHDFRSFMAQGSKIEDTVREIKYLDIKRDGDIVTLRVAADGFLYNMVRIIVGTAIAASEKNLSYEDVHAIVLSLDRKNAGPTAPADGLYLNKVFY